MKRFLSVLLALVLTLGMLPARAATPVVDEDVPGVVASEVAVEPAPEEVDDRPEMPETPPEEEETEPPAELAATGEWLTVPGIEGGQIRFDSSIGAITDCETTVTVANIPSTIGGVSVTSIGSSAFSGCTGLTSVTIPDSVTSIENSTFSGCTSLTNVTIPDSVTSIGSSAFSGCNSLTSVTIPSSVTSIGNNAFSGCNSLTSVTIPGSVTSIEYYAFSDCTGLTSVTIPNSVTSIKYNAFSSCTNLTSVTILGSVTSIERLVFSGCTSLTSVTIPDSVTSIEGGAFNGCNNLTNIYYGGNESQWAALDVYFSGSPVIHYNAQMDSVGDLVLGKTDTVLTLTRESYALDLGQRQRVEVRYAPGDGGDIGQQTAKLKWSVGDPSVVALTPFDPTTDVIDPIIDLGGYTYASRMLRALKPGATTVTVEAEDGSRSQRNVVVGEVLNALGMNTQRYEMTEGKQLMIFAKRVYDGKAERAEVRWTTSDPAVVAFSAEGAEEYGRIYNASQAGIFDETARLYARAPGKAEVTCSFGALTVSAQVEVISAAEAVRREMVANNWYETPHKDANGWNQVQRQVDAWNKACQNYIKTLSDQLGKVKVDGADVREAAIRSRAKEYQKSDESSGAKYIYFDRMSKWTKQWKEYAYRAYCEAIYDETDAEMSLKGINPTDKKAHSIAVALSKSIYKINETYHYGNVEVTVALQNYAGGKMGTITCSDGRTSCTANVISRPEDMKVVIQNYLDEMSQLEYKALDNIYGAVAKDILGESFDKFTEKWLKDEISDMTAEQFQKKGFGKVRDALSYCYFYGRTVYQMIKGGNDKDVTKVLESVETLNVGVDTDSILNAHVKEKAKRMDKIGKELIKTLREYEAGTLTPESALKSAWKSLWNCPVAVEIYDASGTQIGYVGDDDSWYTEGSGIYLEEDSGSKVIYGQEGTEVSFRAVGTDYGYMSYSLERYDGGEPVGRSNFYDVRLAPDRVFTSQLPQASEEAMRAATLSVDGVAVTANEYIPVTQSACVQISAVSEDEAAGTVSGGGAYTRGDAVALHVAAADGYRFVGWYQGDKLVSASPVYEFTAREDLSLTAGFQAIPLSLANDLIQVCAPYGETWEATASQTGDQFVLTLTNTADESELRAVTGYLARYSPEGQFMGISPLQTRQTQTGYEVSGTAPAVKCKLFLLDQNYAPVIQAYLNTGR